MLVLLIVLLISLAHANDKITGQFTIDDGGPHIAWSLDQTSFEATLTMKLPVSWLALGISPNKGKMFGSDAFIAVGKQIYRVQLGPAGPESGAFQTVAEPYADGSIVQSGSDIIFSIRRPLDVEQPWQIPIMTNQPTSVIVAWRTGPSPTGALGKHDGHHVQVINSNGTVVPVREQANIAGNDVYKQFSLPNTGLQVSFSINDDKITFDIVAKSETWIGIGFAQRSSMHPSLAIIGQNSNQVQAYLLTEDNVGPADAQITSELSNTKFETVNGKSRLQFTRPLRWKKSGLSDAYDIEPNGESIVIAATGQSPILAKHSANDISRISWSSASSSSKGSRMRTIALVHGVIMILAWLLLMPIGAVIARYFKDGEFRWFRLHRGLMVSAVALTFLAFVLIVWARAGKLFDSTHGAIGFFVVLLAFMQPLLTMCRNKARPIWRIQHRVTSMLLYIGAVANCFIGATLMHKASLGVPITTATAILLALCVIGLIFLEVKRGRSSHQAESDIKEEEQNRTRAFD